METLLNEIQFPHRRQIPEPHLSEVKALLEQIEDEDGRVGFGVEEMMVNPELYELLTNRGLPLLEVARHSSRYELINHNQFLGEWITMTAGQLKNGQPRREESGRLVQVEKLPALGIDPKYVLYFRITESLGDEPKPEYYWTSDFTEVTNGLRVEISSEARQRSIILVQDLLTLVQTSGGLMTDINDDGGLAVRQLDIAPYDHRQCLGWFVANSAFE